MASSLFDVTFSSHETTFFAAAYTSCISRTWIAFLTLLLWSIHNTSSHIYLVQVLNVKASWWARDQYVKPVSKHVYTYVSVKDNPCWAIFLAGQTAFLRGKVVFGCVECISPETLSPGVIMGFR